MVREHLCGKKKAFHCILRVLPEKGQGQIFAGRTGSTRSRYGWKRAVDCAVSFAAEAPAFSCFCCCPFIKDRYFSDTEQIYTHHGTVPDVAEKGVQQEVRQLSGQRARWGSPARKGRFLPEEPRPEWKNQNLLWPLNGLQVIDIERIYGTIQIKSNPPMFERYLTCFEPTLSIREPVYSGHR